MSSKLNIGHLSQSECERILGVLQRDYHLRNREKTRLRQLAVEIWREQQRRDALLPSGGALNDSYCINCLSRFSLLFNRPVVCKFCGVKLCKLCCSTNASKTKQTACLFCIKKLPEDHIPITPSKPPKPPRSYLYASQPNSLDFIEEPLEPSTSLKHSLEHYTAPDKPLSTGHRQYGSEYSLDYLGRRDSYDGSGSSRADRHMNEAYLRRIESYQKKYGSLQSLDSGYTNKNDNHQSFNSDNLSDGDYKASHVKFCSQCGDHLSPNVKRRAQCCICQQWICKLCAAWEPRFNSYICEEHETQEDIDNFNLNSDDWKYDPNAKKFVRTVSGEIAQTISDRLSDADTSSSAMDSGIPDLSLEDFKKSFMESPQASQPQREVARNQANQLHEKDFFLSRKNMGDNSIAGELESNLADLNKQLEESNKRDDELHSQPFGSRKAEDVAFDMLKETETKKFLTELDKIVKKISLGLANNDSDTQTEEMLTFHRSAISAMVANLEQALHLAVDKQTTLSTPMVKHADVALLVCDIMEEYTGESVRNSVLQTDSTLSYGDTADCILVKILDDEESRCNGNMDKNGLEMSARSKTSPSAATDSSHSDYGSYKLPLFDQKALELDPDLLSISQGSTMGLAEESDDDDFYSDDGSPWDSESLVRPKTEGKPLSKLKIKGAASSNWFFKGKSLPYDSLSGKSNLFNTHSESEESIGMFFPPRTVEGYKIDDNDDSGSESTLTSISIDSGLLAADSITEETPRLQELETNDSGDEMIRTELKRAHSNRLSRPEYISVSHAAPPISPTDSKAATDYTEDGEESSDLKFVLKPKSQSVALGDVAKFTCTVSGALDTDVYWFKEGANDTDALESNEKCEISSQDDKHTLEIFNVSTDDAGQYLCLAKNDITSSHWLFGLQVEESAFSVDQKAPLFLKELYDIEVASGDTAKFRCKIRAYPPPRVTWYKDGKRLENSNTYKLEKFGNRDYMLTIHNVTVDHDAEFTVIARNCAGENKSTAQLLVDSSDGGIANKKEEPEVKVNVSTLERRKKNYALLASNGTPTRSERIKSERMSHNKELSPNAIKNDRNSITMSSPVTNKVNDVDLVTPIKHQPVASEPPDSNESFSKILDAMKAIESDSSSTANCNRKEEQNLSSDMKVPRRSLRAAFKNEDSEDQLVVANDDPEKIVPTQLNSKSHEKKSDTHQKGQEPSGMCNASESSSPETTVIRQSVHAHLPASPANPKNSNLSMHVESPSTTNHAEPEILPSPKKVQEVNVVVNNQPHLTKKETRRVDIQPGFIRERQFKDLGDVSKLKPAVVQNKVEASLPPVKVPETLDLKGSTSRDEIPPSRGEWSDFFPSVAQRRLSYKSSPDPSPSNTKQFFKDNEQNVNGSTTEKRSDREEETKDPVSLPKHQSMNSDKGATNGDVKKKPTKKVIKRTVSIKRTSNTTPSFGDGPPDDGYDYIKICGKWVRMKERPSNNNENQSIRASDSQLQSQQAEDDLKVKLIEGTTTRDSIPASRSEWSEDVSVAKVMAEFKKAQEQRGKIITGRSLGPITKV